MTWMEFIVGVLDKLAWPAVVVFCVIALRSPISKLIPLARKFKFKELEVEFGEGLKAVKQNAEGAFPELKEDHKANLIASANHMPNAAVLEAWTFVDNAAEQVVLTHNQSINLQVDTRYKLLEDTLINEQLIDTKKAKLFNELRQLRNKVAHAEGYEVGKAEAIQYVELCFRLSEYLQELPSSHEQAA